MSDARSTRRAPSRMSACPPGIASRCARRPGTAITSRPCSSARRAVISDPLRLAAWTTTTARHSPLSVRLRRGKWWASGGAPGRKLADQRPGCRQLAPERAVVARVRLVEPTAEHGQRSTGGQGATVRGRVDAARESAGHDDTGRRQVRRQLECHLPPCGRRQPGADRARRLGPRAAPDRPAPTTAGAGRRWCGATRDRPGGPATPRGSPSVAACASARPASARHRAAEAAPGPSGPETARGTRPGAGSARTGASDLSTPAARAG